MNVAVWVQAPGSSSVGAHVPNENCPVAGCHPVAVIDPENREQIAALVELLIDNGWRCTTAHGLRDALREFADPKPQCATCLDKALAGFTCNACGNGAES